MNNYVLTSDPAFAPITIEIPKPAPLALYQTYGWPYFSRGGSLPLDAGMYEFGESYVAEDGRYTAMGPTTIVQLKQNSNYGARFFGDRTVRSVGRVLWCRRVDGAPGPLNFMDYEWRPAGAQQDANNAQSTPKPQLPMNGWTNHILQAHEIHRSVRMTAGQGWNTYDEFPRSPESPPMYAPTILPYHMPSQAMEVRIRNVASDGTSLPSDPVVVPAYFGVGDYHSPFDLCKRERPVWGVKGYYIEARILGGSLWYRQKNPSQSGYLWDYAQTHFEIKNYDESLAVADIAGETAGSMRLSSLHRCLSEDTRSVIVDTDQEIYAPLFNAVDNYQGNCYERTIRGYNGLPWRVIPKNTVSDPNLYWPAFVEGSIGTVIDGMRIESDIASVGIDFCAYSDSAAFRPRISNYKIVLSGQGYRVGVRQNIEARAPVPVGSVSYNKDQHTCSEPIFSNGIIGAKHCFSVEGGQSANWIFRDHHFDGDTEHDSVIGNINNNGQVSLLGQIIAEQGRAFLTVSSAQLIKIENFFSDSGMPCYFCIGNRCAPVIDFTVALANHKPSNAFGIPIPWLHLIEAPVSGPGTVKLTMNGIMNASAVNVSGTIVPITAVVYSSRYVGNRYKIGPDIKFGSFVRCQPDINWWATALADFANVQSYKQVWDNGLDAATVVPVSNTYGL